LRPLPVPVSNAQIQQQSRESGETTESLGDCHQVTDVTGRLTVAW
jgi:hypothetical protein